MALAMIRVVTNMGRVSMGISTCRMSTSSNFISKSVFISQSSNIFSNLALEDWLYRNSDFSDHHIMFLWRNDPCIVIGRHQNPWLEANLEGLERRGITLARRNSGGGTVYHDRGNLNVTFFSPKEQYNRRKNLELISKTLNQEWNLNAIINKREDIVVDVEGEHKISGTAAKIGRPNAYHHCTILVDINKQSLSEALYRNGSVPAPTVNLAEIKPGATMERLMTALGWQYLKTTADEKQEDGGWDLVTKQRGFQLVNPTDDWFPGLGETEVELSSWDWIYGKTPRFEVRCGEMGVKLSVERGIVTMVSGLPPSIPVYSFIGRQYSEALLASINSEVSQLPITSKASLAA